MEADKSIVQQFSFSRPEELPNFRARNGEMDHGKSERKFDKGKFLSDVVSPHLVVFVCVVLAVTSAALVVLNVRMNRQMSALNDALEELRREGKKFSVNDSAAVSSGLGGTRVKRAISNTTPGQKSDIEKRLQAVEER